MGVDDVGRVAGSGRSLLPPGLGSSVCAALLAFLLSFAFRPGINLTAFFLGRQDRWLLLVAAVLSVGASRLRPRVRRAPLVAGGRSALAIAAALLLFCFAGHWWILGGYDMSRDEQMATFDAAVFGSGHLVQTLPMFWRDHADALNTLFMYPSEHRAAWISAYLPGNAVLRALLGTIATPALAGPMMTAIGALALWGCARRIWPNDREPPTAALLLYVGSGQVVVTGMTAYAMPAHLALDLVWLWLFLRGTGRADAAALAVGFVAIGLHQPVMHPLFAAPLLFLLLLERQWTRAAIYAAGYTGIGLFWLWWPEWISSLVQAGVDATPPAGVDFGTRLIAAVRDRDPAAPADMVANLLRFVAWQHMLLLPLALFGWRVARHDRLAGALATGVVLTTFAMTVILPYQGHGFGYRYLHGLIGNAILLAVYGLRSLDQRRDAWRALLLRTSIAGGAVILPLQLVFAHGFYAPAAQASARIPSIDADYVAIGAGDAPFSQDLVVNPPALDKQPLRLVAEAMDGDLVRTLCRRRPRVALVGDRLFDRMNTYYGLAAGESAAARNRVLAPRLAAAGCRVAMLP